MSTYRNAKRDVAVADDFLANHQPCRVCGVSTPYDDLADLGSRCRQCYGAFLREGNPGWMPNRPLTPDERSKVIRKARAGLASLGRQNRDPKAWAHALKAREESGEHLTIAQRDAWRSALQTRAHLPGVENLSEGGE